MGWLDIGHWSRCSCQINDTFGVHTNKLSQPRNACAAWPAIYSNTIGLEVFFWVMLGNCINCKLVRLVLLEKNGFTVPNGPQTILEFVQNHLEWLQSRQHWTAIDFQSLVCSLPGSDAVCCSSSGGIARDSPFRKEREKERELSTSSNDAMDSPRRNYPGQIFNYGISQAIFFDFSNDTQDAKCRISLHFPSHGLGRNKCLLLCYSFVGQSDGCWLLRRESVPGRKLTDSVSVHLTRLNLTNRLSRR